MPKIPYRETIEALAFRLGCEPDEVYKKTVALLHDNEILINALTDRGVIEDYAYSIGRMEIYRAWRDNMLRQGRGIKTHQKQWDTLPEQDRVLDARIAMAVIRDYGIHISARLYRKRTEHDQQAD